MMVEEGKRYQLTKLLHFVYRNILAVTAAAAGALLIQLIGRLLLLRWINRKKPQYSRQWFEKAMNAMDNPRKFFSFLERALLYALEERAYTPTKVRSPANLPDTGICGSVRGFLCDIETRRFSGSGEYSPEDVKGQAQQLFKEIHGEGLA